MAGKKRTKEEEELRLLGHKSSTYARDAIVARKEVKPLEQKLSVTHPWAGSFETPPRDARKELSDEIKEKKNYAESLASGAQSSREEYKKKWQEAYKKYGKRPNGRLP